MFDKIVGLWDLFTTVIIKWCCDIIIPQCCRITLSVAGLTYEWNTFVFSAADLLQLSRKRQLFPLQYIVLVDAVSLHEQMLKCNQIIQFPRF